MSNKQKISKFEIGDIIGLVGDESWKARVLSIGEFYKIGSNELDNFKYSNQEIFDDDKSIDEWIVNNHVESSFIDEDKLCLIRKATKSELNRLLEIYTNRINQEKNKINNLKKRIV